MQMEQAQVFRWLCQGCAWLALGLDQAGLLPRHAAVFNSLRYRFEQRFGFCHRLPAPEPLSYEKYAAVMANAGVIADLQAHWS